MKPIDVKKQLKRELFVVNGQIDGMRNSYDSEKRAFLLGRKFQINKMLEMVTE